MREESEKREVQIKFYSVKKSWMELTGGVPCYTIVARFLHFRRGGLILHNKQKM